MPVSKEQAAWDEAMLAVWKQALLARKKVVELASDSYSVRRTAKRGLVQVDFEFQGKPMRGLEQNPQTKSRWARMARKGAKVMQFLAGGQYVAVVADGKITHYSCGK